MAEPRTDGTTGSWLDEDALFLRRLLLTIGILALCYLAWLSSDVLLLAFGAVLVAILLRALARLGETYLKFRRGWALAAAVILVAAVLGLCGYLFGSQLVGQFSDLSTKLPGAVDAVGSRFGIDKASDVITHAVSEAPKGTLLSQMAGFGSTLAGVITDVALVLVAGIYLAADPGTYRSGLIKLLPVEHHARLREALSATGRALTLWCAGQFTTMAIVGTASTLAYWWIGLPSPLALGFLAGITNFIPFVGPVLSAIPALAVAGLSDVSTVLWTLAAVLAIQQIEGNLVTPMIQEKAVLLPPAVVLFALTISWVVFDWPGLILALPLTVMISVFVKTMWIRETLGEETEVPGEAA